MLVWRWKGEGIFVNFGFDSLLGVFAGRNLDFVVDLNVGIGGVEKG